MIPTTKKSPAFCVCEEKKLSCSYVKKTGKMYSTQHFRRVNTIRFSPVELTQVSRQQCERQKCERHQCEARSANANSANETTVRMRQKCEGQVCEGQECECDFSANGQNSEVIQIVRSRSLCLPSGWSLVFFLEKKKYLSLSLSLSLSG